MIRFDFFCFDRFSLYHTVLSYAVLCYAVLCCTALYFVVMCRNVLYCTVQNYAGAGAAYSLVALQKAGYDVVSLDTKADRKKARQLLAEAAKIDSSKSFKIIIAGHS